MVVTLAVGDKEAYTLTPDMLSSRLDAGNYRIITEVWYAELSQLKRVVWADFTVSESNNSPAVKEGKISLDKVRKLAKKGDVLTIEDFNDFKGADISSKFGYYFYTDAF